MKGCLYLQRRFAYVGNAIAALLKERYGMEEFCGYAALRPSLEFLNNQKEVKYSKLLLEEDVYAKYKDEKIDSDYLRYLEKEYGVPNLWSYINLDRVVRYGQLLREYPHDKSPYTHEEMLKILQATAKALIKFLEEEKPDWLLLSVIGNISSRLLYQIAKKKGIRTFIIDSARIGNKFFLSGDYNKSNFVLESFSNIRKAPENYGEYLAAARQSLLEFQNKSGYYLEGLAGYLDAQNPAKRLNHFRFLKPFNFFRSLRWLIHSSFEFLKYKGDYSSINPWLALLDKAERKARVLIGYGYFYDQIKAGEDYAYFPIHTEPEAYPTLLAPFYVDQLWLIKQAAQSLPVQYKLYVKDHPKMFGYRKRSYYRELKKLPNVKLIKPTEDSLELIKNSKLVITLMGTAGWEAARLKKPVIIFGDIFYDCLSGIKKCRAIEDLPHLVKAQLEEFRYDGEEIVNFIAALFKESADIDLVRMWDIEGGGKLDKRKNELSDFVDLLAKKLDLKIK